MRSLANLIDHIESERAVLDTHFVRSSDIVPFLATIESLAQKVGGKAEVTSVDIPQDDSLLVVELKAGGSFEALYKFVMLLENSPYELLFISANIQNPGIQDLPTSGASEWTATFKINLLSFLD